MEWFAVTTLGLLSAGRGTEASVVEELPVVEVVARSGGTQAAKQALSRLDPPDRDAVASLAGAQRTDDVDAFRRALTGGSDRVQIEAILALAEGRLVSSDFAPSLSLRRVRPSDAAVVDALLPEVHALLSGPGPVAGQAAWLLARYAGVSPAGPRVMRWLLEALEQERSRAWIWPHFLQLCGATPDLVKGPLRPEVVEALRRHLRTTPNAADAATLVQTLELRELGDELAAAAKRGRATPRLTLALAQFRHPLAKDLVRRDLRGPDPPIEAAALVGDFETVDVLLELLENRDGPRPRILAALSRMGSAGGDTLYDRLHKHMLREAREDYGGLVGPTLTALLAIRPDSARALSAWAETLQGIARLQALAGLAEAGVSLKLDELIAALQHGRDEAAVARRTLRRIAARSPHAVPVAPLVASLQSWPPPPVPTALETLETLRVLREAGVPVDLTRQLDLTGHQPVEVTVFVLRHLVDVERRASELVPLSRYADTSTARSHVLRAFAREALAGIKADRDR